MQDYKIEISMTATLTENIVEKIIRKSIQDETGHTVNSITPTYDGTKFTGYSVTFLADSPIGYRSSNEFVKQRWK
jgi:hypothetical protein